MCGICGYVTLPGGPEPGPDLLPRMAGLLRHRGPDADGFHVEGPAGLGHRRLSIIDLGGGAQPMGNADGTLWVAFNGEIYNFPELRAELEARGHRFRTRSDTEVILEGYRAWGTDVLSRLNGMFAFALWDAPRRRLFAARDRLGKKPLYYRLGGGRFLFASELKSILADPAVPREVDPAAANAFFSATYIPAPRTIFRGISKLLPGHSLVLEGEALAVRPYWDVAYRPDEPARPEDDYADELEHLLRAAVKRRLISDVPLGAFLSGGIDSGVVVALMAKEGAEAPRTFTIGFDEAGYSELDEAKAVADHVGARHQAFTVRPEALSLLPDLVWHFDEPFGDSSAVPTYYVSRMARSEVTVALSGDGGDELFAGYNHYREDDPVWRFRGWPRWLRRGLLGPLGRALPLGTPAKGTLAALGSLEEMERYEHHEIFPFLKDWLLAPAAREAFAAAEPPGAAWARWGNAPVSPRLSRMQYLDTKVYLPEDILTKVDRMSMANSLETRAPLLDYTLAEFAARVPPALHAKDGRGKYLLRKVAARLLPPASLSKRKQGFALPRDLWFRGPLRDYARDLLGSERFRARGYFRPERVSAMLEAHIRGPRDYSTWLWCLVNFELWHQAFMDGDTRRV